MRQSFTGNDIVDLTDPRQWEHFAEGSDEMTQRWLERHLTTAERMVLKERRVGSESCVTFWKMFAAKEAAYKALLQSGIDTLPGGYQMLEVDLVREEVTHLPSSSRADIALLSEDDEKVHCIVLFHRNGSGSKPTLNDVLWGVETLPDGHDASDYVRERLLWRLGQFLQKGDSARLAVGTQNGIPRILSDGHWCEWSVSLSHSGRFVAYSCLIA